MTASETLTDHNSVSDTGGGTSSFTVTDIASTSTRRRHRADQCWGSTDGIRFRPGDAVGNRRHERHRKQQDDAVVGPGYVLSTSTLTDSATDASTDVNTTVETSSDSYSSGQSIGAGGAIASGSVTEASGDTGTLTDGTTDVTTDTASLTTTESSARGRRDGDRWTLGPSPTRWP